jgi:hypothetical protein
VAAAAIAAAITTPRREGLKSPADLASFIVPVEAPSVGRAFGRANLRGDPGAPPP